jgi:hypothetical protein
MYLFSMSETTFKEIHVFCILFKLIHLKILY